MASQFDFKVEAGNLIDKMEKEKQILVRILREFGDLCLQDINLIIAQSKEKAGGTSRVNMNSGQSMVSFTQSNQNLNDSGLTRTSYQARERSNSSGSINEDEE